MVRKSCSLLICLFFAPFIECSNFKLKIIHFNDLHARFDEVTNKSSPCTEASSSSQPCVAGVARLITTINRLKQENPNHLVLNAGDVYQGTIWYTLMKWNVSQLFANLIKADAMVLGNHEFDDGLEGLIPFLTRTTNGTPVVVSNLNVASSSNRENSALLKKLVKRGPLKLNVGSQTVGIIGVIFEDTHKITNTAPAKFVKSAEMVQKQSKKLRKQGVNKIIVLSHCGIEEDRRIAEQVGDDIDIIIGGHSHTLLYNGKAPSKHAAYGDYPLVVQSASGHKVLIVQAYCHGHYVGNLDVTFDSNGEIVAFSGQPVYQNGAVEKDLKVEQLVQQLRKEIHAKSSVEIGRSELTLDNNCRSGECKLGSALADAYLWHFPSSRIALIHAGNFKSGLKKGSISKGELLTAMPFNSNANRMKISGGTLKAAVEHGVTLNRRCAHSTLQVSGIQVEVDFGKQVGKRVTVRVRNYDKYEKLDEGKQYEVVVNSYIVNGGDGFEMFKNATIEEWGPIDAEIFERYVMEYGGVEIDTLKDQRIKVTNLQTAQLEAKSCKPISRR